MEETCNINRTGMPVQQAVDPQPQTDAPFQTVENSGPNISMVSSRNPIDGGDGTYYENAEGVLKEAMRRIVFKDGLMHKDMFNNLKAFTVRRKDVNTDLYTVICTIIPKRMPMNRGRSLTEDEIGGIVGMMGSGRMEDLSECMDPFVDAIQNRTELAMLYTLTNGDDQTYGPATGSSTRPRRGARPRIGADTSPQHVQNTDAN